MDARLTYLLQQYIDKAITREELKELKVLMEQWKDDEQLANVLQMMGLSHEPQLQYNKADWEPMLQRIMGHPEAKDDPPFIMGMSERDVPSQSPPVNFFKTYWLRWAAAIILLVGVGGYVFFHRSSSNEHIVRSAPTQVTHDAMPGSDKAVLTLSNGRKVRLDSTSGSLISEGSLQIQNGRDGLVYSNSDIIVKNTMTTPNGGQYQLTLADGTRVWLNAASSITYPTAFKGKTREVFITGEAYFEVHHDKRMPFIVVTRDQRIEVLGTSFNVNAYDDEPYSKTSLAEGSLRIDQFILRPDQAFLNGTVVSTDVARDIAWKNGYFNFQNVKLQEAMRQISRWYDVSVKDSKQIPDIELGGKMGRNLSLLQVLNSLKMVGVTFKLEGRILTVGS